MSPPGYASSASSTPRTEPKLLCQHSCMTSSTMRPSSKSTEQAWDCVISLIPTSLLTPITNHHVSLSILQNIFWAYSTLTISTATCTTTGHHPAATHKPSHPLATEQTDRLLIILVLPEVCPWQISSIRSWRIWLLCFPMSTYATMVAFSQLLVWSFYFRTFSLSSHICLVNPFFTF